MGEWWEGRDCRSACPASGQYCNHPYPCPLPSPPPLSAHTFITRLMAALMTFLVMSTVIRYDPLYNSWRKPMSPSKQLHLPRRLLEYQCICVFRTVRARFEDARETGLLCSAVQPKLNWTNLLINDPTSLFSSITRRIVTLLRFHSYPPPNKQHNAQIKRNLNQSKRPRQKCSLHRMISFLWYGWFTALLVQIF